MRTTVLSVGRIYTFSGLETSRYMQSVNSNRTLANLHGFAHRLSAAFLGVDKRWSSSATGTVAFGPGCGTAKFYCQPIIDNRDAHG